MIHLTEGQSALAEAARLEAARVYGRTCREHRQAAPVAEPTLFARPLDSYYGPAPAPVLDELVDALAAAPQLSGRRIPRTQIEQGIARGRGNEQIAALLDVAVEDVEAVRAAMDRMSA